MIVRSEARNGVPLCTTAPGGLATGRVNETGSARLTSLLSSGRRLRRDDHFDQVVACSARIDIHRRRRPLPSEQGSGRVGRPFEVPMGEIGDPAHRREHICSTDDEALQAEHAKAQLVGDLDGLECILLPDPDLAVSRLVTIREPSAQRTRERTSGDRHTRERTSVEVRCLGSARGGLATGRVRGLSEGRTKS